MMLTFENEPVVCIDTVTADVICVAVRSQVVGGPECAEKLSVVVIVRRVSVAVFRAVAEVVISCVDVGFVDIVVVHVSFLSNVR